MKDPNKIIDDFGKIRIEIVLNIAKDLPKTTVAMVQVARAERGDNGVRSHGEDNYSTSFDRLMDSFDTFILETSNNKRKTGSLENYDFNNPRDLTLYLLWQIRHIRTHDGGLITDYQDAKERYEKCFKQAIEKHIMPLIELPENLEPGMEVTFNFEDYKKIKENIFAYLAERIPKKDLEILQLRSALTSIKTEKIMALIELGRLGPVEIDLIAAFELGFDLDLKTGFLSFPPNLTYFPRMNQLCVTTTGKCIPVEFTGQFSSKSSKKKK